ncbi:histidine kinase [Myxococcota bacterium]|nr:histidine kinase [Myxococcota bacterium]
MTLWRDTLTALAEPRRAAPIALVAGALLLAQWWFTATWTATLLAAAMALCFLLVAPTAWRALFPPGQPHTAPRLLGYGLVASLPALLGALSPDYLRMGPSFLSVGVNILVIAALSIVGGWGLARDIELERGLQAAQARAAELARQAERAELLALRAHLDPHFLFNTLNAIAEWTREDPAVAEEAILRLSALLREVMAGVRAPAWPLHRELAVARAVWELHAVRDPDRFRFTWTVPEPVPAVEVPPLVLLPVVENAVKHGPAAGHRGTLELRVDDRTVTVRNPGPFTGPRDGGEGLSLVRRRLASAGSCRFEIRGEDAHTVATLHLPEPPCGS